MRRELTPRAAEDFIRDAQFYWHQRFQLAPGVYTPGANDIGFLLGAALLPDDLRGASVLDIGATNGGLAFELERLGAGPIVTVDIYSADWFGFEQLKALLNSDVEYLRSSVYELPSKLDQQFDIVAFCGVLYHLRHPLLALDAVRELTAGRALIETAIRDRSLADAASLPLVHFHRLDDLNGDGSNWFEPSLAALTDWCRSCGLDPVHVQTWPPEAPGRCMLTATPTAGPPEYLGMSYELPLTGTIAAGYRLPGDDPAQRAGYEALVRRQRATRLEEPAAPTDEPRS
jgi:tRNA (mo5U34)-methyltransferase